MNAIIDVILPVFGIILAGFLAGRFRVLGADSAEALNRFVYYFALPPLMFLSTARVPIDEIFRWSFLSAYLLGAIIAAAIAVVGAATIFGLRRGEVLSLHALTAMHANTGYLGIPLFLAAFGENGILPAVITTAATNTILIALAIAVIETTRSGDGGWVRAARRSLAAILTSPLLIGPAAGIAASALSLAVPSPIERFLDLLGATAGPGALFALGLALVGRSLAEQVGELTWLVAIKLLLHPLVTWLLVAFVIPVDPEWGRAAVLLAAMPTGALVYVLSQQYGIYVQRSSATILVTTILSVLTLSVLFIGL